MDELERRQIIAQSFEALESVERYFAEAASAPPRDPEAEDALERWARQRPPPAPPRSRPEPTEADLMEVRSRQWETWARAIIQEELQAERELMITAAGQAMGEIRAALRDRIAALESRVESLAAELAKQRAIGEGAVVDLPPVIRRRSDGV
jgi:hypothetical protein